MGSDEAVYVLAERQRQIIEELQQTLTDERERLRECEAQLAARSLQVEGLQSQRERHLQDIADLERTLGACEEAIAILRDRAHQDRAEIEAGERAYRAQTKEMEGIFARLAARFVEVSAISVLLHDALETVLGLSDIELVGAVKPAISATLREYLSAGGGVAGVAGRV